MPFLPTPSVAPQNWKRLRAPRTRRRRSPCRSNKVKPPQCGSRGAPTVWCTPLANHGSPDAYRTARTGGSRILQACHILAVRLGARTKLEPVYLRDRLHLRSLTFLDPRHPAQSELMYTWITEGGRSSKAILCTMRRCHLRNLHSRLTDVTSSVVGLDIARHSSLVVKAIVAKALSNRSAAK